MNPRPPSESIHWQELEQRRREAKLPLPDRLRWLEEDHELANAIRTAPTVDRPKDPHIPRLAAHNREADLAQLIAVQGGYIRSVCKRH
jgi:hypothetical protein